LKASHNMFNGLAWGPDGWLYGRQGILANSLVGKPGTGLQGADVLSIGHLVVILAIIFGNVIYFAGRGKDGRARAWGILRALRLARRPSS